jgi:hypothetical protein
MDFPDSRGRSKSGAIDAASKCHSFFRTVKISDVEALQNLNIAGTKGRHYLSRAVPGMHLGHAEILKETT